MKRLAAVPLLLLVACAGASAIGSDYFRHTSFELPGHRHVVLRWRDEQMPLRVHLPMPSAELFEDPQAVHDSVRDGIVDWSEVVAPGLPRFEFVGSAGDADIPIVWAAEPDGDWYVAHCAWDLDFAAPRFGVSRILVTARWGRDLVDLTTLYETVLHEMGHALGIGGHSPVQGDIMYPSVVYERTADGLSDRDRATLRKLYGRPFASTVVGGRGWTRR